MFGREMLFSIVIPTLNRKSMLQEAIASVRYQRGPLTEVIVVDGGSTDGSIEWINSQSDICLVGGPDWGVYDALNKGIAAAQGDVIGFLNSDDSYEPGAFEAAACVFNNVLSADSICGVATLVENRRVIARYDKEADKLLSSRTCLIGNCVLNARFFRRASIEQVGNFDTRYRYVADRDWLARWQEVGMRTIPIAESTYVYRRHPGSLTFWNNSRHHSALRWELLQLARSWQDNVTANAETRRIAALLEGRCIMTLSLDFIRALDVSAAARLLFTKNSQRSFSPLVAVMRGIFDFAAN